MTTNVPLGRDNCARAVSSAAHGRQHAQIVRRLGAFYSQLAQEAAIVGPDKLLN